MLFVQCLLFLPGCTFIQWSNATFRQADKISEDYSKTMDSFIQSTVVYNEFASIAEFSALLLTDESRMIYSDYFFHRNFKTPEEKSVARQRLLTENDYYITFYVIGYQPSVIYPTDRALFFGEYQVQGPLLGTSDANWKMTLLVDDKEYAPCDVRSVQLPSEYQYFFGRRWSQFKSAYKVRFDSRDLDDHEVVSTGRHDISLKFNSAVYSTKLDWKNISYSLESRKQD